MVYILDKSDRLCGVTYIDWTKTYSKIPKATCEMLEGQCGGLEIDFHCGKPDDKSPEKVIEMSCVGKGKSEIITQLKSLYNTADEPIVEFDTGE